MARAADGSSTAIGRGAAGGKGEAKAAAKQGDTCDNKPLEKEYYLCHALEKSSDTMPLKTMDNRPPVWIRLDNAATIYPATMSKKYAAMFRMTITLNEEIDSTILQQALENVIGRFPTFRYCLRKGIFWCYFKRIDGTPQVQEDVRNPMVRIDFRGNSYFMFRVRYFGKRIAVEYFHALTDGTGGHTFIMTLTAEYLRIKHGIGIDYGPIILNPAEKVSEDEYSDDFWKYARKIGGLDNEHIAYQAGGTLEDSHILNIVTGTVPVDVLAAKAKEHDCTVTQYIVSMMIMAMQDIQETEKTRQKRKKPIKVCVPMNLRKIYPSRTMRNFSSYALVGIETMYGHYSLEEVISQVKHSMALQLAEKRVNAKITGNINLEKSYFVKLIPMIAKKYIISTIESLRGGRYFSTTFTNIGIAQPSAEMIPYIEEIGFLLGRQRINKSCCGCVSFNGKAFLTFTRKIKEPQMERLFFTRMVEAGVPVEIESNNLQ